MISAPFRHTDRVTYADCTLGDHVYYARYLELLEAARGEFHRHLGVTFRQWQERDVVFPVIECRLRYKVPARYDEVLTIELWPTLAERARLNFSYRMIKDGAMLVLEAETFHVCASREEKPKRLPEDLVRVLTPYLRPAAGTSGSSGQGN
jgi:acyl-CoA thioester hydrolase